MLRVLVAFLSSCLFVAAAAAADAKLDTAKIEQITGVKGSYSEKENVFKVSSPRADVKIAAEGWSMPPFMGLTSYAAFIPAHGQAMVMGDTVLLEDEVNPAMSAALDSGLEVTALHNHFFFDQPKVYFMHIGGTGSAEKLAGGVKNVWDKIKEVRANGKEPAARFGGNPLPAQSSITAKRLQEILGVEGQSN